VPSTIWGVGSCRSVKGTRKKNGRRKRCLFTGKVKRKKTWPRVKPRGWKGREKSQKGGGKGDVTVRHTKSSMLVVAAGAERRLQSP